VHSVDALPHRNIVPATEQAAIETSLTVSDAHSRPLSIISAIFWSFIFDDLCANSNVGVVGYMRRTSSSARLR
jgi:hypothetical protein